MPTTNATLTASPRDTLGKDVAKVRKAGRIPAVIFGHGIASIPISLDAHEFEQLRKHAHANMLIDLAIEGGETRQVMLHGLDVNPRNRRLMHVDLYAVKTGEEVTVDVPIVTVGESEAVAKRGGVLLQAAGRIRVRALPEKLPEEIQISIESLVDFDTAIHVSDLVLPDGVTLLSDADELVAKVEAPHAAEPVAAGAAPEEAPEEAAAAPEEGSTES